MLNSTYRASFWGMKPIIYQNDLTGIHLSQRIGIGSKARDAVGEQMNTHDPRPHQQLSITSRPVAKEEGCRLEGRAEVLLLCTKLHSDKSTQRLGFSLPGQRQGSRRRELKQKRPDYFDSPKLPKSREWMVCGQPGLLASQPGKKGQQDKRQDRLLLTLSVILLLIPRSISILSHSVTPMA